jgi:uncharacterized protein (TIGR02246 family)
VSLAGQTTPNPPAASSTSTEPPRKIEEAPGANQSNVDPKLKEIFQAKVQAEWQALKNKDKKAYADLLADDYQGVEIDGKGERTKKEALTELAAANTFNYTLWGFKVVPIAPDAALVIYESTMQYPPGAQVRLTRVYISELWVKRDGQWKELHYQETHVK